MRRLIKSIVHRLYPNINTRLTIPFLVVILAVAGIGVFIATRLVAGSIEERLVNQLRDSVNAANNTIVEIERQMLATLRLMAFTSGVPDATENGDTDRLDILLRPVTINNGVYSLFIYNNVGESLYQLQHDAEQGDYLLITPPTVIEDWPGVQRIISGSVDRLGDKFVDIDSSTDERVFYINAPLVNERGVLVGGIAIGITTTELIDRVSEQSLSAVILYNPDGEVMGTNLSLVQGENIQLANADQVMQQVREEPPILQVTAGRILYQVLHAPLILRDQQIGILGIGLSNDLVTDQIATSRDTFVTVFSAMFIGVAALGIWVARSINNPIRRLIETTRAIRSGDLTRRVQLSIPDELGELSDSFDHMTNQLVERNEEISALYIAQLEETARRDAVLEGIGDVVIVLDENGEYILRNPAADTLITEMEQSPAERREQFEDLLKDPTELLDPVNVTLGEEHYNVLATPVFTPTGILGHVIVFRNITPIIQAERLKDEMILQLSHELRTPLTAARGYVDLLAMFNLPKFDEQSTGFFNSSTRQLDILSRMINQVVDVSAILANQYEINFKPVELTELVYDVFNDNREEIKRIGLKANLFIPKQRIWLYGDADRLKQAIEDVLRNAYSYTLAGGWIEIAVDADLTQVNITISDSGVGVEADEIPHVFERMYRGKSADAGPTDARGLGLGLYLAKHIVEAHQGTIHLESQPNMGTIVTIHVPRQSEVIDAT